MSLSGEEDEDLSESTFIQRQKYIKKRVFFTALNNGKWKKMILQPYSGDMFFLRKHGETFLTLAAEHGNMEVITYLISKGTSIKVRNSDGETPLHLAAKYGHLEAVKLFLNLDEEVDIYDAQHKSPFYCAVRYGHSDVVKFLLERGANVNTKTNDNCSPLLVAVHRGFKEIVEMLLKAGAIVDDQDIYKRTPLFHSLEIQWPKYPCLPQSTLENYIKHKEIVKLLLGAKADCNKADIRQCTPFNVLTTYWKDQELIKYFVYEHGAIFKVYDYEALVLDYKTTGLFRDSNFCSKVILNKVNKQLLPDIYALPGIPEHLLPLERMEIKETSRVAQIIHQEVKRKITVRNPCDVLRVRPMALTMMVIRNLVDNFVPPRYEEIIFLFNGYSSRCALEACECSKITRSFN